MKAAVLVALVLLACASPADKTALRDDDTTTTLADAGVETVCWVDGASVDARSYLPCTDINCADQGLTNITCVDLPRAQVEAECFETGGYWDCSTAPTSEASGDGLPPCGPGDDPASGMCVPLAHSEDWDLDGVRDTEDPDVCMPPEQTPVSVPVCDSQGHSTGVSPGPEVYEEIADAEHLTGEELADAACEQVARAVEDGEQTTDYERSVCPRG